MAIAFAELTQGSDTTNNPSTTASITPTANAQVFAAVVVAQTTLTGITDGTLDVIGCNLTWSQVTKVIYGADNGRRILFLWRGVGASPTTGSLTITYTPTTGTWTENMWSIDEATGVDATTPLGTAYTNRDTTGTTASVTVSDTPDAGDFVYSCIGEESDIAVTPESGFTTLSNVTGGSDGRVLVAMYDGTPTIDTTPSATWTGANSWGIIGIVVNVAAEGGDPEGSLIGGKLIRGGLLKHGVLVGGR